MITSNFRLQIIRRRENRFHQTALSPANRLPLPLTCKHLISFSESSLALRSIAFNIGSVASPLCRRSLLSFP